MSTFKRFAVALSMAILLSVTVGGRGAIAAPNAYPAMQTTLPAEVLQTQWVLEYFNTDAKSAGHDVTSQNITIEFETDGTLHGSGGCNSYSGTYTVSGQQMTISDKLTSTAMACEQAVMDQESLYFRLLPTVNAYNLNLHKLDLLYQDGHNAMTFIPGSPSTDQGGSSGQGGANSLPPDILNTRWTLQYFTNATAQDVTSNHINIIFAPDGTFEGSGGCNNYFGSYTVSNLQLTIGQNLGSTQMFCEQPAMAMESLYFRLLLSVNSYQITNGNLQLIYGTGDNPNMLTYVSGTGRTRGNTSELPPEVLETAWTLKSLGQDLAESGATIKFLPDGTFYGYDGCNNFSGSYTVSEGKLTIGPVATTGRICPETALQSRILALESRFLLLLPAVKSYTLANGQLSLDNEDTGNSLVFVRTTRALAGTLQPVVVAGMPTTGGGVPMPLVPVLLLLAGSLAAIIAGFGLRKQVAQKAPRK